PLRHERQVLHACFSADGSTLLTATMACGIRLWSVDTGELLTGILRQSGQVGSVSFSPDGRQILVASQNHTLSLGDLEGADSFVSHLPIPAVAYDVVFSPDSRLAILLTLSGGGSAWDLATAKPLRPFGTEWNQVRCAQFSADGRRLALGSSEGSI